MTTTKTLGASAGSSKRRLGKRNGHAKLTESQVFAIRADVRAHKIIAHEYGISLGQVSGIQTRRYWSHLREAHHG